MIPILANQLGELQWRRMGTFSRNYELKSGDSVLATLEFQKPFGTLAEGRTSEAAWTFKRNGFLRPKVSARIAGREDDLAVYEPEWGSSKGTLRFPDSATLLLESSNLWNTEWTLETESGEELVLFRTKGLSRAVADLTLTEGAKSRSDLGLLLSFAWYVLVLRHKDHGG